MSTPPIVLDANLLVLFVVGSASRHKRLKEYSASDFDLLVDVLSAAPDVLLTPNTLTETSNLIGNISEPARTHIYTAFRKLIGIATEHYLPSSKAAVRPEFLRLGLTDAALLDLTPGTASLLTADLDLYLAALAQGSSAYNFNHLRDH